MTDQNNVMYKMVREFHNAFGHKMADKPTVIDEETALNRAVWTGEELVEFLYGTVGGDLDKFEVLYDSFKQGLDKAVDKIRKEKKPVDDILVAQIDALVDVEYFNQGSFTIAGVEPFNLFKIVQEANMGKLFSDGKPRFREEDGKIIKPPNWEEDFAPEPRLIKEIERQMKANKNYEIDKYKEALEELNLKLIAAQNEKKQNSLFSSQYKISLEKETLLLEEQLKLNKEYSYHLNRWIEM